MIQTFDCGKFFLNPMHPTSDATYTFRESVASDGCGGSSDFLSADIEPPSALESTVIMSETKVNALAAFYNVLYVSFNPCHEPFSSLTLLHEKMNT